MELTGADGSSGATLYLQIRGQRTRPATYRVASHSTGAYWLPACGVGEGTTSLVGVDKEERYITTYIGH